MNNAGGCTGSQFGPGFRNGQLDTFYSCSVSRTSDEHFSGDIRITLLYGF